MNRISWGLERVGDSHKASYVPSAIIYARVEQSEEWQLDQFPCRNGHGFGILVGDAKFHMINLIGLLEERAKFGWHLANLFALISLNEISEYTAA